MIVELINKGDMILFLNDLDQAQIQGTSICGSPLFIIPRDTFTITCQNTFLLLY